MPEVAFNEQSIERVLSNLITNAIKYSPDNSRVKIRAEIAKDPKYLEVTVEDMGMGIAPEYQEKIFDRFFRIENATHTIKGTGLGLHLVKIAIEKHHNGKVFVHSKVGEGSTFGFWLPLDAKTTNENEPQNKKELVTTVAAKKEEQAQGQEKVYVEPKISTINDYDTKAKQDAEFIGKKEPEQKNTENKSTKEPQDDGWEITFEVRDKNVD